MEEYSVCVLMSTYNGEKFIQQQLDSLYKQKEIKLSILVRDDGSTDRTQEILEKNKLSGKLDWYTGKNLKPALSFMDLVYKVKSDFDFYAFCDQDDVWLPDKLINAVKQLTNNNNSSPALYYGRPRLVDSDLNPISVKKDIFTRSCTFGSAVINSGCAGCTMVFNKELLRIIKRGKPNYITMHDAWIHKVCAAFNGKILFDDDVHMLYRQHGSNSMGVTLSRTALWKSRLKRIMSKECKRSRMVKSIWKCYSKDLPSANEQIAFEVCNYRKSIRCKIRLLLDKRIHSDSATGHLYYKLEVLLGKF